MAINSMERAGGGRLATGKPNLGFELRRAAGLGRAVLLCFIVVNIPIVAEKINPSRPLGKAWACA